MKRYRVFSQDFDFTGNYLKLEIMDDWDEQVKALHRQNHEQIIERLSLQYGQWDIEQKVDNLRDIGGKACSIVAYHNRFYHQAREAFIFGAYYPALTAACALGERILNHLILDLRDEYQNTPEHEDFATGPSFPNWRAMIRTLESWGVLFLDAADQFRALHEIRNRAIHFNLALANQDREMAMAALKHVDKIIAIQFGSFGPNPWFIDVPGVAFIRKEWEDHPFVKLFYLPKSGKFGPNHRVVEIDTAGGKWVIEDDAEYEDREITDEEFVRLYEAATKRHLEALAES
jgi:hypothetical protein